MAVRMERDGHVATLVLSRPEALNAFDTEQLMATLEAVSEVAANPEVRVVILTGDGAKAFAAGADIKEMSTKSAVEGLAFAQLGQSITVAINAAPQAWIAAINGHALGGGCEMALACDIRLMSESASIGQPEVGLGILPGWGATQRLTRLLGPGLASDLIFSGRRLRAPEALRIGLVNAVYPADELLARARELADLIGANSPRAIADSKRAIAVALESNLATGLAYEAQLFGLSFGTHDQREGMAAFVEKRSAEFNGS
jgi:enoyl-CoA hydratase